MTRSVDPGLRDSLSRAPEAAILGLAIIIVFAIGTLSYVNNSQTRDRISRSRAVRDVQKANAQLLVNLGNAESGQRGFLLTGQAQYLPVYEGAASELPQILSRLENRSSADPKQAQRIASLKPLVRAELAELNETIQLKQSNHLSTEILEAKTSDEKRLMDAIRRRCFEINQSTEQRILESSVASDVSTSRLRFGSTVGSVFLLGLVLLSAVIISRSLTRRDELFNQARTTRELLFTTLSSIADGVVSTDARAQITFMNAVAERLTGWPERDAVGRNISEVFSLIAESTREPADNPLQQALTRGVPIGLANHTRLIARDGREISIDDIAAPIRHADGGLLGAVLVFRDVSDKRRSEQDLAEAAAALQRSNEELQQFAFAASHDLRSPLNSVNAIAQLLAKRFAPILGKEGSEMIGYITEGVGRMSRLIEDLLSLATATSSAGDVFGSTCLQDAFETALHSLDGEVQQTGASITFSAPLPAVAARDTHVVQILQNIFGNAIKYRGSEPPAIHLSALRERSEWTICVKDNGIGFDPKFAEHIFQPFKRLHGHEYEGSGIGLATCKRIVAHYGGRIWAVSTPGKGSSFFFSLPGGEIALAATANGQWPAHAGGEGRVN